MKKVIGFYNSLEAHLLVISLAFTTLLIFVQVVMRYVFNNSLSWSEELARYVFIWQIWLGTSVSMKGNDHIRMDMLSNKLKGRGKLVLAIVANVILLLFCVFLVKYGFDLVMPPCPSASLWWVCGSSARSSPLSRNWAAAPARARQRRLRHKWTYWFCLAPLSCWSF